MAIIAQTQGIFRGLKIGTSKAGKDWYALRFSIAENYKGMNIPPEQLSSPNCMLFPANDELEPNDLNPGQKYNITVSISTGKTGTSLSILSYKTIS